MQATAGSIARCLSQRALRAARFRPPTQIILRAASSAALSARPGCRSLQNMVVSQQRLACASGARSFISTPSRRNSQDSGSGGDQQSPPQTQAQQIGSQGGKKQRAIHKNTEKDLWEVVRLLREDNVLDVVTIDVRARSNMCDFFVIATCRAGRHMSAVSNTLTTEFKERRRKGHTLMVEGEPESKWMIVNMSDIQVHLMEESERRRLELEKLWTLGADDDQLRDLENTHPDMII